MFPSRLSLGFTLTQSVLHYSSQPHFEKRYEQGKLFQSVFSTFSSVQFTHFDFPFNVCQLKLLGICWHSLSVATQVVLLQLFASKKVITFWFTKCRILNRLSFKQSFAVSNFLKATSNFLKGSTYMKTTSIWFFNEDVEAPENSSPRNSSG